jgi:cell division inhibitor SepF
MSALSQTVRGLRNLWGHADDEDYAQDEVDTPDNQDSSPAQPQRNYSSGTGYGTYNNSQPQSPAYGGGSGTQAARRLRPVPSPLRSPRAKNIYTLKPKSQDDAAIAADALKTGDAVIINLEDVDRVNAIRIIDFMSGVCYGLENQGHAMKLGDAIFLYTPGDFDISSDEVDYGENPEFFFKDIAPPAVQNNTVAQMPSTQQPVAVTPAPLNAQYGNATPQQAAPPPTSPYGANERRSWER